MLACARADTRVSIHISSMFFLPFLLVQPHHEGHSSLLARSSIIQLQRFQVSAITDDKVNQLAESLQLSCRLANLASRPLFDVLVQTNSTRVNTLLGISRKTTHTCIRALAISEGDYGTTIVVKVAMLHMHWRERISDLSSISQHLCELLLNHRSSGIPCASYANVKMLTWLFLHLTDTNSQ